MSDRITELETTLGYRDCQITALKQVNDELEAINKEAREVVGIQLATIRKLESSLDDCLARIFKETVRAQDAWQKCNEQEQLITSLKRRLVARIAEVEQLKQEIVVVRERGYCTRRDQL